MKLISQLKSQGFLPLISKITEQEFYNFIDAAVNANVEIIEYAARDKDAKQIFKKGVAYIKKNNFNLLIGIGSMITLVDVKEYCALGADFVVCPNINPEIGKYCTDNNIPWMPGGGTASEIQYAHELGATVIKIFPADCLGGPNFAKAILGPLSHLKLMPTGGVGIDVEQLMPWFKVGVVCVGIGSNLIAKADLASVEKIENRLNLLINNIKIAQEELHGQLV